LRWITNVVTDPTWLLVRPRAAGMEHAGYDDEAWQYAVSEGKLGAEPWGKVFKTREATSAESIQVMPDF